MVEVVAGGALVSIGIKAATKMTDNAAGTHTREYPYPPRARARLPAPPWCIADLSLAGLGPPCRQRRASILRCWILCRYPHST
jgi:hypothetical protein